MSENCLKQIMQEKMVSPAALAKKTGLKKQQIWSFENGRGGLSIENLQKISDALGVSLQSIMGKNYVDEAKYNKKILEEAMDIALEYYSGDFSKEEVVKIASEIYSIIYDYKNLENDKDKEDFKNILDRKVLTGLAAKSFLIKIESNSDS